MKKKDFSKLKTLKKEDKILLLTHTDMDGATPIILGQMFDDLEVWHCSNGKMSYLIKKAIKEGFQYDTILVTDISCTEEDAKMINKFPNSKKLVLLDHHPTAMYLNNYDWAVVEPFLIEDSYRAPYFQGIEGGHSSGTSLLYDFLDYQGHTTRLTNKAQIEDYVHQVALYDTWDWYELFDQAERPKLLENLFDLYGATMFEKVMVSRLQKNEPFIQEIDQSLLKVFQAAEKIYVFTAKENLKEGTITIQGKDYSFLLSHTASYLDAMLDTMKETNPEVDLYIVNYGSGLSIRTANPNLHMGELVAPYGGGGHAGAGGVKIEKEARIQQIEQTCNGTFFLDKTPSGWLITPKDVKEKPIDESKYESMDQYTKLKEETEDRKRTQSLLFSTKEMVCGTYKDSNGNYQETAIAFTSKYQEDSLEEMKIRFPNAKIYFICEEKGCFVYDSSCINGAYHSFSEDLLLNTISKSLGNATIELNEKEMDY